MFLLTLIFSHFQVILVKMLLRSITQKNCWDKSRYYLVIKLDNWQNKQGDRHFIEHLQDGQIKSFLRASSSPLRSSVTQGCHLAFWKDDCCLILVNFSFCPFEFFPFLKMLKAKQQFFCQSCCFYLSIVSFTDLGKLNLVQICNS